MSTPKYRKRTMMSVEGWVAIADNPRQRDTERHARKAVRDHLSKYHPVHQFVQMGELPDGSQYKLDGHTRALLWGNGKLPPPAFVYVDVWDCADLEQVKSLYRTFDYKGAVETGTDQLQGAMREARIELRSPYLNTGRFGTAIREAFSYVAGAHSNTGLAKQAFDHWDNPALIYSAVRYFANPLQALDQLEITQAKFPTGVMMGAFITLSRPYPAVSATWRFWAEYSAGKGYQGDDGMNAVRAFMDTVARNRKDRRLSRRIELFAMTLSAVEAFIRDYRYASKGFVRPLKEEAMRALLRKLPPPDEYLPTETDLVRQKPNHERRHHASVAS
jgi:hypothetical protein